MIYIQVAKITTKKVGVHPDIKLHPPRLSPLFVFVFDTPIDTPIISGFAGFPIGDKSNVGDLTICQLGFLLDVVAGAPALFAWVMESCAFVPLSFDFVTQARASEA